MIENYEVGQVVQGKVTGIQPYGAFVALDDEVQGLVHISEVTHGYVKDINEFLSVGDEVSVKILQIDAEKNKISLSIRATQEAPQKQSKPAAKKAPVQDNSNAGFNTLKDKLQEWMDQSDSFKK
ncbi:S1 domain-containing post-transcriptional regulator GSP13 [Virgibacillus halophilus]|uniref:S1 domain-containing post-transcriptional regulator GSP13 n=1 Tax=Tigheibacillus halophilus TaxID=361280 RepID=UPI003631DEF5